jgi:hypothetical protein
MAISALLNKSHPMNLKSFRSSHKSRRGIAAFSLEEAVAAISLSSLCFTGSVKAYGLAADRAEWSACSLAAQSLAYQRLEQVKIAKWDTMMYPQVDELVSTNFPAITDTLDMPLSATNTVAATVYTTISSISSDLRSVQVDCVWTNRGKAVYTNTVVCYRSPSQ